MFDRVSFPSLSLKALIVILTIFFSGHGRLIATAWAQLRSDTTKVSDSMMAFLPGIGIPALGKIEFTPFGRFGYRKVGWSAIAPVPFSFSFGDSAVSAGDHFTIRLKEVDLWVAETGIEARFGGDISVVTRISGNLLQDFMNSWFPETREEAERILWKQRNFSWIELEAAVIKPIISDLCIKTGLKYDDFRLAFKDPYEIRTVSDLKQASLTFKAYQADSYIWLPYLGLGWNGKTFKVFIVGSLFAPSKIRLESRISSNSSRTGDFSCYTIFSSAEPASYLEMNLEYFSSLIPVVNLSLWGKSGWLQASGRGEITNRCITAPKAYAKDMDESSLTFTRYDVAAGLSLNISF